MYSHYDGKLYASQANFRGSAQRINHYLDAWNAAGFRSGFMHYHQEWLHDLNVKYDASTFDTDPFEPQPDGVGTIFPFWVPAPDDNGQGHRGTRFVIEYNDRDRAPSGRPFSASPLPPAPAPARAGYVELPYTLPQDSTLFLLLKELTGDIWHRKLDWIARHGGMALINVHPDYLHLKSPGPGSTPTAGDHYAELLGYLTKSYGNTFWHVLPRDMAAFVHQWKDRATLSRL